MLSWSRTSQAAKLALMATIWCKVDGVIFRFNDMWHVHGKAILYGCLLKIGFRETRIIQNLYDLHHRLLGLRRESLKQFLVLFKHRRRSVQSFRNGKQKTSSSPSEINPGVLRAPSAASGTEGADALEAERSWTTSFESSPPFFLPFV